MGFTDVGKAVRSARVLLKPEPFSVFDREGFEYSRAYNQGVKDAILHFMQQPTADVVYRDVLEQVMWERDLAISQLAEIGKGLGEKMADVVKERHGRWIEHERAEEIGSFLISNYECSKCHRLERIESDYCPNCGAKMDEVTK